MDDTGMWSRNSSTFGTCFYVAWFLAWSCPWFLLPVMMLKYLLDGNTKNSSMLRIMQCLNTRLAPLLPLRNWAVGGIATQTRKGFSMPGYHLKINAENVVAPLTSNVCITRHAALNTIAHIPFKQFVMSLPAMFLGDLFSVRWAGTVGVRKSFLFCLRAMIVLSCKHLCSILCNHSIPYFGCWFSNNYCPQ